MAKTTDLKKIDIGDAMNDGNVLMEVLKIFRDVKKPYQLTLESPDRDWNIDFANCKISPGKSTNPDLTISMKEQDLLDLISGKQNVMALFMEGKVKLKGNMGLLIKLQASGIQGKLDKIRSKY
jgi:putative sterol carrier protein